MRGWPVAAELSPADPVRVAGRSGARRTERPVRGVVRSTSKTYRRRGPRVRDEGDLCQLPPPRFQYVELLPPGDCPLYAEQYRLGPDSVALHRNRNVLSVYDYIVGVPTLDTPRTRIGGVGGVPHARTDGVPCDSATLESVVCESRYSGDDHAKGCGNLVRTGDGTANRNRRDRESLGRTGSEGQCDDRPPPPKRRCT